MRLLAIVMLIPTVALAGPETVERELRELALPEAPGEGGHVAVFAQLVAGSAVGDGQRALEGTAAVGADLRHTGTRCDHVRAGGQARIAADARVTFEQWASACLPIFIMELGHHLEWDVRPALLAPLAMRAGVNRRETVRFRWQPLRARLGPLLAAIEAGEAKEQGIVLANPIDPDDPRIPSGDGIVFDTTIQLELLWTPGGELATRIVPDVLGFGYERAHRAPWGDQRNFAVDLFRGGGVFVDNYDGERASSVGSLVRVDFVKIENLALGPLFASGGIGIASGAAGEYVDAASYEREVDITRARALLALETGGSSIHGHVRATHDLDVAADGYVTVDARVATGLGAVARRTRLDLSGAIARTEIHVPGAMPIARGTGGGSLAIAYALAPLLDATLRLDVARSFYAANVTQLDFVPRWGAYAFAGLQARARR
jgi:hypothetical protein